MTQSVRTYFDNQNYLQLAAIQSASVGLPGILLGPHLAQVYGVGTAICSILVGNLILWLIGIAVISMVDKVHINAIQNIKKYVGDYCGVLFAFVLIVSFLTWFSIEINMVVAQLNKLIYNDVFIRKDMTLRLGACLGLLATMMSLGGIRLLRRISMVSLPAIFLYYVYSIFTNTNNVHMDLKLGISFMPVMLSVLNIIAGVINYPTFFRHSRSNAHSFFSLTLITVFISVFEIASIWMVFSDFPKSALFSQVVPLTFFLILTLTNCNLLNIYLASSAWEAIVPRFSGAKGYAIIGLLGTLTYTFFQISESFMFLEDLTNAYIAILGLVLMFAFLLRLVVQHRPRPIDKLVNILAWILGCLSSTIYEINHPFLGVDALVFGLKVCLLFYLIVLFFEEVIWASKKKWKNRLKAKQ